MTITVEHKNQVAIITINRPERRNAVDSATAQALFEAFQSFDADPALSVAILTGANGNFCAGADLQAFAAGEKRSIQAEGELAPMGPSRLRLSKPVIAAVEGYAVAGGLELALWADLRVVSSSSIFGVFCRRFGVPLIDLGTIRLPRLIGQSRAADMILTGREVAAEEALEFGLANRLVEDGQALVVAIELAEKIAAFPQRCMRNDRLSMLEQWGMSESNALKNEVARGLETIDSGESLSGAASFGNGKGRHGEFE